MDGWMSNEIQIETITIANVQKWFRSNISQQKIINTFAIKLFFIYQVFVSQLFQKMF